MRDIATLARQVRALGQAGDLLLAITIAGNEPAMLEAVQAALERDMTVVAPLAAMAVPWRLHAA